MAEQKLSKLERDYAQMQRALRRILQYQSPDKLRRDSHKDWGCDFEEAISMAYENIQLEAKSGLKGTRKLVA